MQNDGNMNIMKKQFRQCIEASIKFAILLVGTHLMFKQVHQFDLKARVV